MSNAPRHSVRSCCFWVPNAHPLFDPCDRSPFGGIETRAWSVARQLPGLGCRTHVIVRAPYLFRHRTADGVELWNASDGFDQMRNRFARWKSAPRAGWRSSASALLWQAPWLSLLKLFRAVGVGRSWDRILDEVDADCHVCIGVSRDSLRLIRSAHERGKPCVLMLASLDDLNPEFRPGSNYRTPHGEPAEACGEVLRRADAIVAQTEEQAEALQSRFGRDADVIANPIDLAQWDQLVSMPAPVVSERPGPFVVWIGRADRFHKRPLLALQLAWALPEVTFLMVLNPGEVDMDAEIRRQAPANVRVIDRVPFGQMPALFANARAYLSTGASQYEGMPNVFLQAAASRTPVLSLEVAGGLLDRCAAGALADGDMHKLTQLVQRAWRDEQWRTACGQAGRAFVEQFHAAPQVAARLRAILSRVTEQHRQRETTKGEHDPPGGDA
ncbi:MAG: glycosyltransferase family 4 protein [Planctomycetaceae bacterium]